jgi:hypothetical protein
VKSRSFGGGHGAAPLAQNEMSTTLNVLTAAGRFRFHAFRLGKPGFYVDEASGDGRPAVCPTRIPHRRKITTTWPTIPTTRPPIF